MRTHEAGSRQWDRSRSDCPRQGTKCPVVGVRTSRGAFAPQRGTPLLAPSFRIVS